MAERDDIKRSVREAAKRVLESAVYFPDDPPQLPEWFETKPVRVAVNRFTGERIFLDTDGMWRYLPTKEKK